MPPRACGSSFFFFNDTATTEIYTLSLHDALPIYGRGEEDGDRHGLAGEEHQAESQRRQPAQHQGERVEHPVADRSEEHTSELQSRLHLVCRLLLEKKKKTPPRIATDAFQHKHEPV